MWQELIGTPGYAAGTSGTVNVPAGASIVQILAHATGSNGAVTIFGGNSIPIIASAPPTELRFNHMLFQSTSANGGAVVFTGTDSYFVHWVKQGNA